MGGPGSGPRPNSERRGRILALRADGLTIVEIARRLGVTHQAVQQQLRAAGTTPRRGVVRCRACGAPLAAGHHLLERNRPPLCLRCLAKRPGAPFAERLKAHRLAAGLTQAELAARARLAEHTICAYERGAKRPKAETLARLGGVLGPGLG
jgi:transcriptional regulator with XRE-family HTH domain